MKKFIEEFKAFAMRGNVIDLAVGVIIGGAFKTITDSLVNDVISPLLGLVFKADFSSLIFKLNGVEVKYGAFITAVINFIIMAFVIFCLVKALNKLSTLKFKKKEEEAPAEPTTKVCPFCLSEINIKATKCCHCTSDVE